jgi:hypothetical protein
MAPTLVELSCVKEAQSSKAASERDGQVAKCSCSLLPFRSVFDACVILHKTSPEISDAFLKWD